MISSPQTFCGFWDFLGRRVGGLGGGGGPKESENSSEPFLGFWGFGWVTEGLSSFFRRSPLLIFDVDWMARDRIKRIDRKFICLRINACNKGR